MPNNSKRPSDQEELAIAVVMLVFSALVLFGLVVKPSESISEGMKVLIGVLASLAALLAMLVMTTRYRAVKESGSQLGIDAITLVA